MGSLFEEMTEPAVAAREYRLTVVGRPQQRGSKTPFVRYDSMGRPIMKDGRVIQVVPDANPLSKDWMERVKGTFRVEYPNAAWLEGPLGLAVEFYFLRPKSHYRTGANAGRLKATAPRYHGQTPDLDKLVRAIGDSLSKAAYRDDAQIAVVDARRLWTERNERAVIRVWELG